MSEHATAVDLFAGCGGTSCGLMQAGIDVVAMVEWNTTAALTYCVNLCRYNEMQFHFVTKEDEERMNREVTKQFQHDVGSKRRPALAGSGWIRSQPKKKVRGCRHVIIGDIRKLRGRDLLAIIGMEPGELGHMAMSPPCQGFSTANSGRDRTMLSDPRNDLCFEAARLVVECQPKTISLENVPNFGKSQQYEMFCDMLRGGPRAVDAFYRVLEKNPHWRELLEIAHAP